MKLFLSVLLKRTLLAELGVTKGEVEQCFLNRRTPFKYKDHEITFLAKTDRGRSLQVCFRLSDKIIHTVKIADRDVQLEQDGTVAEILSVQDGESNAADQMESNVPDANENRSVDIKIGIPTVSFKCDEKLHAHLTALAGASNTDIDTFIRQTLTRATSQTTNFGSTKHATEIDFGDLRRTDPFARDFGFSTGQPIDRYYIDQYLANHRTDICGSVLEIADNTYTKRFGNEKVTESVILNHTESERATIIGDLVSGLNVPREKFDCIILTQTLPFIFEVQKAIDTCFDALKNEGVLLCTVNGISQVSRYDMERWGDYWRFTTLSLDKLLSSRFPAIELTSYGNALSATAFLMGLPAQSLQRNELNHSDADYPVLIGARAKKSGNCH